MTKEHLTEIEAYIRKEIIGPDRDEEYLRELVAEVRRLQEKVEHLTQQNMELVGQKSLEEILSHKRD